MALQDHPIKNVAVQAEQAVLQGEHWLSDSLCRLFTFLLWGRKVVGDGGRCQPILCTPRAFHVLDAVSGPRLGSLPG